MKNFAIIGAAGFIAQKHLRAIQATGNNLVAAMDKFDSVGILDSYFPDAHFFTELERFDRFLEKARRSDAPVNYLSVCTPNYLHDAHVRLGLKQQADVICEKPLVLNPWNVEPLARVEEETGQKVFNLLQLRLHPDIVKLKESASQFDKEKKADIDLAYITPRGAWYGVSWKGDVSKSGGIATNIGIHFFDMLIWIFGKASNIIVHALTPEYAAGYLELERARVRWFLSIDRRHLPTGNGHSYRAISVNGKEIEFSKGFTDLHTKSYEQVLAGQGFGLMEALPAIELVHAIRTADVVGKLGEYHPLLNRI